MTDQTVTAFRPRTIALPGDIESLCRQYLAHLSARGYSDNTLAAYRRDLEQFAGFLAAQDVRLIQTVATRQVDGFIDALLAGEGLKPRTAARKLESVKGLFRFAVSRDLISEQADPCRHAAPVRFKHEMPIAPEAPVLTAMIDAIPADSPENIRDRALFRLLLDAGLRIGGALSLDVYDPMDPPAWAVYPGGTVRYRAKGGDTKESVCDARTLASIEAWLEVRHRFGKRNDDPALFLSKKGGRLTRQGALVRLNKHAKAAGLGKIQNHSLRHARAAQTIAHDPHLANYLLGHSRLSTTVDMYGAQSPERMRARIARECPVDGDREVA